MRILTYTFSDGSGGNDIVIHASDLTHARFLLGHFPIVFWQDFGGETMDDWHPGDLHVFSSWESVRRHFAGREFWCMNFVG